MSKGRNIISIGEIPRGTVVEYQGGYYVSLLNSVPNGKNRYMLMDGVDADGKFKRIYPHENVDIKDVRVVIDRGEVPVDVLYFKYFMTDNIKINEDEFETYMFITSMEKMKYFISMCIMRNLPDILERVKILKQLN